jgi:hypothetical protein
MAPIVLAIQDFEAKSAISKVTSILSAGEDSGELPKPLPPVWFAVLADAGDTGGNEGI